jgi:micrococcal nuclease
MHYQYRATLIKVVDGDTIDVKVDLGFHIFQEMRLRLADINTPELRSADPAQRLVANQARDFVQRMFDLYGHEMIISTDKDRTEKYGRYLATVHLPGRIGDESLNQLLLENGLASPYKG